MESPAAVLEFNSRDRVLVFAPHPDDEVLATGGLIQHALAASAKLRVIVATDGDNNPWPQRWAEKRWDIDVEARARWGARRRKEAVAALYCLGVADADVRFLGWPDQGLTDLLIRDGATESLLAAEIAAFRPSLIVAPVLADTHPDHNALRVMLELALARVENPECSWLGFRVHGELPTGSANVLDLSGEQRSTKQRAILEHRSQLILSRKRMLRLAGRAEIYLQQTQAKAEQSQELHWSMPLPGLIRRFAGHALMLVVDTPNGIVRLVHPVKAGSPCGALQISHSAESTLNLTMHKEGNHLTVQLSANQPMRQVFAKLERMGDRVFIHDVHGWVNVLDAISSDLYPDT